MLYRVYVPVALQMQSQGARYAAVSPYIVGRRDTTLKRIARLSALFGLALSWSASLTLCPVHAQTLDYSGGFADTSALTANQNYGFGAIFFENRLRLTDGGGSQAGSVFATDPVTITRFATTFNFRLLPNSNPMADGMTFTIQGVGANALGPSGGGLGYGPDQPAPSGGIPNSVAIKFDTYSNAGEGVNSTGLYLNGEGPVLPSVNLDGTGIDLHSQHTFRADLTYDGIALEVTLTDLNTGASFSAFYNIDIAAYIGSDKAWVGFTGGTGGLTATQEILTWKYSSGELLVGAINLEASQNLAQVVTFTFQPLEGGQSLFRTARLSEFGEFALTDVPAGYYLLSVKGDRWLQTNVPVNIAAGGFNLVEATLRPGDLNDDNLVDLFDLVILFNAYGTEPGDADWNEAADLDCDSVSVDLFDLVILFNYYGEEGDL